MGSYIICVFFLFTIGLQEKASDINIIFIFSSGLISLIIFILLSNLLAFHLYLFRHGKTTYEYIMELRNNNDTMMSSNSEE